MVKKKTKETRIESTVEKESDWTQRFKTSTEKEEKFGAILNGHEERQDRAIQCAHINPISCCDANLQSTIQNSPHKIINTNFGRKRKKESQKESL